MGNDELLVVWRCWSLGQKAKRLDAEVAVDLSSLLLLFPGSSELFRIGIHGNIALRRTHVLNVCNIRADH